MPVSPTMRSATAEIGARIRAARQTRRCSQKALAEKLGMTFQQVQKYESGKNRVATCTLVAIAKALNLEIGFFLPNGAAPVGQAEIEKMRSDFAAARIAIDEALATIKKVRELVGAGEQRLESAPIPFPVRRVGHQGA